jgi:hypothetical protein
LDDLKSPGEIHFGVRHRFGRKRKKAPEKK